MTLPAVRTVVETDSVRVVEGLAYPFRGRDTYGTFFSRKTEFSWELFPDIVPGVRSGEPRFIRPVTFEHGTDPKFGLARVGGWSPIRIDEIGVWVRAQLERRS